LGHRDGRGGGVEERSDRKAATARDPHPGDHTADEPARDAEAALPDGGDVPPSTVEAVPIGGDVVEAGADEPGGGRPTWRWR
jgi:hypothetical protein